MEFLVSPSIAITLLLLCPNFAKAVPYANLVATFSPSLYAGRVDNLILLISTTGTEHSGDCSGSLSSDLMRAFISANAASVFAPIGFPCQLCSSSIPEK